MDLCLCDLSFYVWEIMHSTIKKMSRHVDQLQSEVDQAHDKQEEFKRKVSQLTPAFVLSKTPEPLVFYHRVQSVLEFFTSVLHDTIPTGK